MVCAWHQGSLVVGEGIFIREEFICLCSLDIVIRTKDFVIRGFRHLLGRLGMNSSVVKRKQDPYSETVKAGN